MNRESVTVDVRALDVAGAPVGDGKIAFEKQPAGTLLVAPCTPRSKAVVTEVEIDGVDPSRFSSKGRVIMWEVEVPHEEVNFDTAKHDLKSSEKPKLDAVLPKIKDALTRYSRFKGVRFWIVGHTDSIDDRAYNQALSERRARTIAQYFMERRVRMAISYAGLGEELLLVATPDETPELRNRRATYLLSVDEPSVNVKWTPLP